MKLFIKNMISIRCKMVVQSELESLGFHCLMIDLGEVVISEELSSKQLEQLRAVLLASGLEILDDKKAILNERIKNALLEIVYGKEELSKINISDAISAKLQTDYNHLASLFSELNEITIEQYYIKSKIERVKELLLNENFTLTEISYRLNYCSVAHLSTQFKRITGLTPTFYRKLRQNKYLPMDNV